MPKIENVDMTNRSIKEPSEIDHILWWFAAGNKEILKDSVNSRFNYKIVGLAVMVTWIFATFSWFFYASTIFSGILPKLLMGGFMGYAILTIDRTLVAGKFTITGFIARLILATLIGAFVGEAWILFIYKDDINRQIPLITETKVLQQRNKIDSTYSVPKKEFQILISTVDNETKKKYEEVEDLRKNTFKKWMLAEALA
ncbi:MAG: DUF4407 domain-containing protein [Sphingobacteriales bacterium JAD_PAG50586_3]|nr:MAG: DUF4407 domain-containing protein [Sphingobacteriales bacterium JAD_PAG50586_3]